MFFAPGRVNLIGAHLDYNGGDVLPLALDLGVYVAARLRDDDRIRMRSIDRDAAIDVSGAELGARREAHYGWASYPLGVWRCFAEATGQRPGVDLLFGSDLPIASGLSSSAAIEIATAFALDALCGTGLSPVELARIGHRAETGYVGLQCGIMDQFASALGKRGHALWLHCRDESCEHVPIAQESFEVLLMDTRKTRSLADSMFNERVRECAEALQILCEHVRPLEFLADCRPEDLEQASGVLAGLHLRRARHVVTEMERVAAGVEALRRGDIAELGRALTESHESTRVDYEVSCDELDFVVRAACEFETVFGARLTGAGFGGCAIALVEPGQSDDVIAAITGRYRNRFGVRPGFQVLHAGGGPRRLSASP